MVATPPTPLNLKIFHFFLSFLKAWVLDFVETCNNQTIPHITLVIHVNMIHKSCHNQNLLQEKHKICQ